MDRTWLKIIAVAICFLFALLDLISLVLGVRNKPPPSGENLRPPVIYQGITDKGGASGRHPLLIVALDVSASLATRDPERTQSALADLVVKLSSGDYGEFLSPGSALNLAIVPFSSSAGVVQWDKGQHWIAATEGNRSRIQSAFASLAGRKSGDDPRCGPFSNKSRALERCRKLAQDYLRQTNGETVRVLFMTDGGPSTEVYPPSSLDDLGRRIARLIPVGKAMPPLNGMTNLAGEDLPALDLKSEWMNLVDPVWPLQRMLRDAGLGFQWMSLLEVRTNGFALRPSILEKGVELSVASLPDGAGLPASEIIRSFLAEFGLRNIPIQGENARIPPGMAGLICLGTGSATGLKGTLNGRPIQSAEAGGLNCLLTTRPSAGDLHIEGIPSGFQCLGRCTYHWLLTNVPVRIDFYYAPVVLWLDLRDERNQAVKLETVQGTEGTRNLQASLKGPDGRPALTLTFSFNPATHRYECPFLTQQSAKELPSGTFTIEVPSPFSAGSGVKSLSCKIKVEGEVDFHLFALQNGTSLEVTNLWSRIKAPLRLPWSK